MIVYLRELVHHLEDGLRELELGALVVCEEPGERRAVVLRRVQLLHDLVQGARVQPVLRLGSCCWTRRARAGDRDIRRRIHLLGGLLSDRLDNNLKYIVQR